MAFRAFGMVAAVQGDSCLSTFKRVLVYLLDSLSVCTWVLMPDA
jgi:hypothetical protein